MEKEKIVAEFFKRGHLLTDEALKIIEERSADEFLDRRFSLVIGTEDLQQPYRIIKNITQKKKEITKEDFVRFFNSRYGKMREIITARLQKNFVSLNKIDSTRNEVYTIGIVREIKEKDGKKIVELEDQTATVPVIFEDIDDIELDDVIAVHAIAGGKVLFGKKILYPDIPLRKPTTGTGSGCFISDLRLDEASQHDAEGFFEWFSRSDIPYLFVSGNFGDKDTFEKYVDRYCYMKTVFVIAVGNDYPQTPFSFASSRIVSLSNPAMVEISGLKILLIDKADAKLLKKRHLGRATTILDEDYLVLDDVPDIVHYGCSDEPYVTNYKSVTFVNSGSLLGDFRPVVINFATRDVEKIAMSIH